MRRKIVYIILTISFCLFSCKKNKRALVVGKIQAASKLATTEFTVDKIVYGTKTKKLFWIVKLNEARFLAYSKAIIKTGIDLSEVKSENITIDQKKIEIKLPPVKVINFSYPPSKFHISKEVSDNKIFNKVSLEDQEQYFREAELDIRNNLEFMGVVETTQQHTKLMLTALFKSLGYTEIYISFESDELLIDKVELITE